MRNQIALAALTILLPLSCLAQYRIKCGKKFDLSRLGKDEYVSVTSHDSFSARNSYPSEPYSCTQKIKLGSKCKKWNLHCSQFETNGRRKIRNGKSVCRGDTMTVIGRTDREKSKIGVFCGSDAPSLEDQTDERVMVRFRARRSRGAMGYNCSFTCTQQSDEIGSSSIPPEEPEDQCFCGLPKRQTRIVQGHEAEVNEYPWQVGLVLSSKAYPFLGDFSFCGGTLVSDRHVITAAHCIDFIDFGRYELAVLAGEHDTETENESDHLRIVVEGMDYHEKYEADVQHEYDHAVLKLDTPIKFKDHPHIRPACLPSQSTDEMIGAKCVISGWGNTESGGSGSNVLLEASQEIISNEECTNPDERYRYPSSTITDVMFCGLGQHGQDTCQGDSGGPFVCRDPNAPYTVYQLMGITSFGRGCGVFPGVYARVYELMDEYFSPLISDAQFCMDPY